MNNSNDFLQYIGALFVVVITVVVAAGTLLDRRRSRGREMMQDEIQILQTQNARLKQDIVEANARAQIAENNLASKVNLVSELKEIAQQTPSVELLISTVDKYQKTSSANMDKIMKFADDTNKGIKDLTVAISSMVKGQK